MKYLWFKLSGGENYNDAYGCIALTPEFYTRADNMQRAVEACRALLTTSGNWYGDVIDFFCFPLLRYDAMDAALTDGEKAEMSSTGYVVSSTSFPGNEGSVADMQWHYHQDAGKVEADYSGLAFTCRRKHYDDHTYWAGRFMWGELLQWREEA